MQSSSRGKALFLFSVALILMAAPVSADWNITVLDQPYSFQNVSNTSETVQVINLTTANDDEPINESQLVGDSRVEYKYNGSTRDMEWMQKGYWYADFQLNNIGGTVEFEAEGETESSLLADSPSETNATRTFNLGNMSVDLMTDFSGQVNPEESFDIKVNVTDTVNDTFEDQANVDLYLTNGTWTSPIYGIGNKGDEDGDGNDDHYKNFGLDFNLDYDSKYVLHVNATNTSSVGYNNSYGVESVAVETVPEISGEIDYLNTSAGCNNESFFRECERGAEINTGFNVTESEADSVNLSIEVKDSETGNWEYSNSTALSLDNGLYTGQITVPDINTSSHDRKFRLHYNASNGNGTAIVTRKIDYRDFKIVDKSNSVTGLGDYKVKLEIRKYFTPSLLESSRIDNGSVEILDPSGNTVTSFNISDMERKPDPGYFSHTIEIPTDSETGIYDMEVEVTNIYNSTKSDTFRFDVEDIEQTFTVNDGDSDFERTVDKIGVHEFNITVENELDAENNISTNVTGEISNFTTINGGENISLNASDSENITVEFDVDSVDEYSGEIKFMDDDSEYNSTLDVLLERPGCNFRNETLCVTPANLNASADERGEIVKTLTVINFGKKGREYNVSFGLSGNVTDYAEFNKSSVELNTENDTKTVDLTYSATVPGFFSGTLTVDNDNQTVAIPISLDSDVEATDTGINITSEAIDLGELTEGDTVSRTVDLENTGDLEITDIEFTSGVYTVSTDSIDPIPPGESMEIEVQFLQVASDAGTLTVTGRTASGEVSDSVDVSASLVPDYVSMASQLESRVLNLDSRVDADSEHQTDLNNVQTKIQNIKSAYRQGNYDRAETLYNEAKATVDSVEQSLSSQSTDNGSQTNTSNEGEGLPLVPIAIAVFILLVIGFILYTSIIPEEGDPLYSVLGE